MSREMQVGDYTLREGTNGRVNGFSKALPNRLGLVLTGELTTEQYVAAIHREVADGQFVHSLSGVKWDKAVKRAAKYLAKARAANEHKKEKSERPPEGSDKGAPSERYRDG